MATFSLCPHMVFFVCVCTYLVCLFVCPNGLFLKEHQSDWIRAHPSSRILTYSLPQRACLQIQWHSALLWVRASTYKLRDDTIQPITESWDARRSYGIEQPVNYCGNQLETALFLGLYFLLLSPNCSYQWSEPWSQVFLSGNLVSDTWWKCRWCPTPEPARPFICGPSCPFRPPCTTCTGLGLF